MRALIRNRASISLGCEAKLSNHKTGTGHLTSKSRSCIRFCEAPGVQNHTLWSYVWCCRPFVDLNNPERLRPFTRVA